MRTSIRYFHSFIMLKFQIYTRERSKGKKSVRKNWDTQIGIKISLHFGALPSLQESFFWQHKLPSSKLLSITDGKLCLWT